MQPQTNSHLLSALAAHLAGQPLLMLPTAIEALAHLDLAQLDIEVNPVPPQMSTWSSGAGGPTAEKKIAVIPITGTLCHRGGGFMSWFYGGTSYGVIRSMFNQALDMDEFSAILFNIDSNGGVVNGCMDLVDEIHAARGKKPIYAMINEGAYSAAYAIASAADRIYLPRTGGAGSIGVMGLHIDQSGWDQKNGVNYTYIYKGQHKVDGNPHQPLSKQARTSIDARQQEAYDLFCATVARNRKLKIEDVEATEAQLYQGQQAVDAGLADAVMSEAEAIEDIFKRITKQTPQTGGFSMSLKKQFMKLFAKNEDEEITEALATLGFVPKEELDAALANAGEQPGSDIDAEKIAADAAQKARDDMRAQMQNQMTEIITACHLADKPQMALEMVKEGLTPDQAKSRLQSQSAAEDQQNETSSFSVEGSAPVVSLVAEAQRRADAARQN